MTNQHDLFAPPPPVPPVQIYREWLPGALNWMQRLDHEIPWQQHRMPTGTPMPRQEVWFSETPATYSYSGETYRSEAMLPMLRTLLDRVNTAAELSVPGWRANAVFANLYRDGSDSIGWHADSERVLGPTHEVVIASLSVGVRRRFKMRHVKTGNVHEWALGRGDLLFMKATSQSDWVHCIPKGAALIAGRRINLTFRRVM